MTLCSEMVIDMYRSSLYRCTEVVLHDVPNRVDLAGGFANGLFLGLDDDADDDDIHCSHEQANGHLFSTK